MKRRNKFLLGLLSITTMMSAFLTSPISSKAYMVNNGICVGTGEDMVCIESGDEAYEWSAPTADVHVSRDYIKKHFTEIMFNNMQNSSPTGEKKIGYKYFIKNSEYPSLEDPDNYWVIYEDIISRLYTYINSDYLAGYSELEDFWFTGNSITDIQRRGLYNQAMEENETIRQEATLKAIENFDLDARSCADGYSMIPNQIACVANGSISIPDKYTITQFEELDLAYWSKGNTALTYKADTRRTVAFSLPTDIRDYVENIVRVKITYTTCDHKTGKNCDEEGESKTVDYYDTGTLAITRSKDRTFITEIPILARTSELLEIANKYDSIKDSKNGKNEGRLFNDRSTKNLANAYDWYLVLNVEDTMYIEMIEVESTLYTGETITADTEGSVIQDKAEKTAGWLAFLNGLGDSLKGIALGILVIVVAIVLVPIILMFVAWGKNNSNVKSAKAMNKIANDNRNAELEHQTKMAELEAKKNRKYYQNRNNNTYRKKNNKRRK